MKCHNKEFISIASPKKEAEPHTGFPDTLTDYLSGKEIPFSNRDNIRQKIVKFLVEEKGYRKEDIFLDREIKFEIESQLVSSPVDIAIGLDNKTIIVFKCASGSVVSRERQIIATARLLEDYVVPFAVVTNGVDLELLDTISEKVLGEEMLSIPTRQKLFEDCRELTLRPVNRKKLIYEQRVLYTYDGISCAASCKAGPSSE